VPRRGGREGGRGGGRTRGEERRERVSWMYRKERYSSLKSSSGELED